MEHRASRVAAAAAALACVTSLAVAPSVFGVRGGRTRRVSVSSKGAQSDRSSFEPSVSADGRLVAFTSYATNLVPGDTNGVLDVFVYNRRARRTKRVSVNSSGVQGNGASQGPSISADGRFVAFESTASNLAPGDTNNVSDVFVYDRKTHLTSRASVASGGAQANASSTDASISRHGRVIAFESFARNLVPGDTNGEDDVFVHNRTTNRTQRVSVGPKSRQAKTGSYVPAISANRRFVAFSSGAGNLVHHDRNHDVDIFVRDRKRHRTRLVSVNSRGRQAHGGSYVPDVSANGRFVTFTSNARNLAHHVHNRVSNVFVRDRKRHRTRLISVGARGKRRRGGSYRPAISPDGRFVAFSSPARGLVRHDTNHRYDIFVRDRRRRRTRRVSRGLRHRQANGDSFYPAISRKGRFVAFASGASNLVRHDGNGLEDVFLRGPLR